MSGTDKSCGVEPLPESRHQAGGVTSAEFIGMRAIGAENVKTERAEIRLPRECPRRVRGNPFAAKDGIVIQGNDYLTMP